MKLSISRWRTALSTLGVTFSGNRKRTSRTPPQSTRLHAEVLEDRWTPSAVLSIEWSKGPNPNASERALSKHLALPEPVLTSAPTPAPTFAPTRTPAPVVESLQALLDGPNPIVDLGGQTWIIPTRLTITTKHSGKTIQNGTIKFTFEGTVPRVGGMEIVQGKRWYTAEGKTVYYPSGNIDLTLRNVILDGDFPYDYGLQAYNEFKADELNKGYNLITTVSNAANSITLENVRFQNSGNSAIAGSFKSFSGRDISADRVAKHVIGLRGFGGTYVDIDRLVVTNSGNVIDFHNDGSFFDAAHPDVAVVNNITARNIRGRSKVAGNNWSIDGANWWFEQDSAVNLNLYPAFDLAKHPRRFVIDGFVAINFPTLGIGTLTDDATGGEIRLSNVYIYNSLSGIKVQQDISVVDSEFDGLSCEFRSSVPEVQSNIVYTTTQTDTDWAATFDQINLLYEAKNAEWGTQYVPKYWAPNSVQVLMEEA